jgi:heme-degrading monooxygenase HmoA
MKSAEKEEEMFLAMNRFKVIKGVESDFEAAWKSRDSHLRKMKGFVEFHLLRGPERDDHTLYASHTTWASEADFEAWTKSEEFRNSHKSAGNRKPMFLGHPELECFHTIQSLTLDREAAE